MFVFVCAGCGAELTVPLSRVTLPAHARQQYGNGLQLPVLMEPGTFAVDPEPWGPPWRTWEEVGPEVAAARGVYAPVPYLSDAPPGAVVMAPGDTRGTVLLPERAGGYCCGLGPGDGPNMACEGCGLPVATRVDDCSLWQAVWLARDAVHRLPVDGTRTAPLSWEELPTEGRAMPPFEPRGRWGFSPERQDGSSWSPRWEAAAGQALAHLLAASEGGPVSVPHGLAEVVFQRSLDLLLPTGPPPRRAVLAGPGLPAFEGDAPILLVPAHPETGRTWTPDGGAASASCVPLPFGVWLWLVSPERYLPAPASGALPEGVLRDDPPPAPPDRLFRADPGVFGQTLARLPAVRSPWLRTIHENLSPYLRARIF
ncbi:hypothetical protein [Streptomyces aureus]|uniref:hypothetical protein n=1 Tax=Streptomyces aureus TaxID=193461 RepID=UPI00056C4B08|nr:hypothetical protein [Streptomyces aureus]